MGARERPAQNRHRFMKSLTSHGLRSSGSRKDARNATVKRNEDKLEREAVKKLENIVPASVNETIENHGSAEKLDDSQNISDQSWDDEVAGELAKLRAELSAATANS